MFTPATPDLIKRVLNARRLDEVFDPTVTSFPKFRGQFHEDYCKFPGANDAFSKLGELKELSEKGYRVTDESGTYGVFDNKIIFTGDDNLLYQSLYNYSQIHAFRKSTFTEVHFHKYLPKGMVKTGTELTVNTVDRLFSVSGLKDLLDPLHVNWMLSRMLEFSLLLEQTGFSHMGINPESVLFNPETHGIQVVSFYHACEAGQKGKTICGRYKSWYPTKLIQSKQAGAYVDIELAKRTAAFLYGDRSGIGYALRTKLKPPVYEFLMRSHTDAFKAFDDWKTVLKNNFESKFLPFNP